MDFLRSRVKIGQDYSGSGKARQEQLDTNRECGSSRNVDKSERTAVK
jgi:hypothetical protein